MNLRFLFTSLCLICISFISVNAQRSFSISAGAGTAYYYGDLTDNFNNSFVRPAASLSLSGYILPSFSIRMGITHGYVGASDSQASNETRRQRDLHFRSFISELSLTGVYEILPDRDFGISWKRQMHFTPYLFGGIAVFGFDPKAELDGTWYRLQPLGTEGQFVGDNGKAPYSLIQASVPFGGGISMRVSPHIGFSMELGYRSTFTDYIDDVSTTYPETDALSGVSGSISASLSNPGDFPSGTQRGNPGAKDSYFFSMVSVVYYFDRR